MIIIFTVARLSKCMRAIYRVALAGIRTAPEFGQPSQDWNMAAMRCGWALPNSALAFLCNWGTDVDGGHGPFNGRVLKELTLLRVHNGLPPSATQTMPL